MMGCVRHTSSTLHWWQSRVLGVQATQCSSEPGHSADGKHICVLLNKDYIPWFLSLEDTVAHTALTHGRARYPTFYLNCRQLTTILQSLQSRMKTLLSTGPINTRQSLQSSIVIAAERSKR